MAEMVWFPHSRILQRDLCGINELVMVFGTTFHTHQSALRRRHLKGELQTVYHQSLLPRVLRQHRPYPMQDCRPHRFISATSWNKIAGLEIAGRLRDWYSSKWWYEEQYQRMYGAEIDNGELDRAVACVAEVFNAQWAADTGLHPAHSLLLATGTLPLAWLYKLGTDLLAMEAVRRLPSFINYLKQPSHYDNTLI